MPERRSQRHRGGVRSRGGNIDCATVDLESGGRLPTGQIQREIAHAGGPLSRDLRASTNARGYYIASTTHRASLDRVRRTKAAKLATCETSRT